MKHRVDAARSAETLRKAIDLLAVELEMPVEKVERVYRDEALAIGSRARIQNYVPVLVASRVRSELRRRQRHS